MSVKIKQRIEEILYNADISEKESKHILAEIIKLIEENYVSKEEVKNAMPLMVYDKLLEVIKTGGKTKI